MTVRDLAATDLIERARISRSDRVSGYRSVPHSFLLALADALEAALIQVASRDQWRKRHDAMEERAVRAEEALRQVIASPSQPWSIARAYFKAAEADTEAHA